MENRASHQDSVGAECVTSLCWSLGEAEGFRTLEGCGPVPVGMVEGKLEGPHPDNTSYY